MAATSSHPGCVVSNAPSVCFLKVLYFRVFWGFWCSIDFVFLMFDNVMLFPIANLDCGILIFCTFKCVLVPLLNAVHFSLLIFLRFQALLDLCCFQCSLDL